MIDRRSLIAATPGLLATPALAAPSRDLAVRGSKAYSESAMVMSVTPDGRSALTLRFCRFPVEGQTWLWCHVFHEGRFYAFTSHDLACLARGWPASRSPNTARRRRRPSWSASAEATSCRMCVWPPT